MFIFIINIIVEEINKSNFDIFKNLRKIRYILTKIYNLFIRKI